MLSLLLHIVAIALIVFATRRTRTVQRVEFMVLAPPASARPQAVPVPAYAYGRQGGERPGEGGRGGGAQTAPRPVLPDRFSDLGRVAAQVTGVGGDSTGGEGPIGTGRTLGPDYATGRLWARTSEAAMGLVGPVASAEVHVARVDSAVRAKIAAFVDTMPRDSFAMAPPPVWTTEINGKPWGIDGQWIYLGDLKVPTALLALLPFPQGNYDQARRAAELQSMREDIIQAARRAETAEQFRKYVAEIRKRKDAERAARKAAERDTIIP